MLNTPLMVRLLSRTGSLNLTGQLLDEVQYGNATPGGYTTAQCKLSRPLDRAALDLAPYTGFEIVDTASGQQLWFGRLEDPGRTSREQVWDLNATGWSAHAQDRTQAVSYQDSRMSQFVPFQPQLKSGGDVQVGASDSTLEYTEPAMTFAWPKGVQIAAGRALQMQMQTLVPSGQHCAYVRVVHSEGMAGAGLFVLELVGRGGLDVDLVLATATPTTGVVTTAVEIGNQYVTLHTIFELRLRWTGGTGTLNNDTTFSVVTETMVQATRMDRWGDELMGASDYDGSGVPAHAIIEDLLGRFLPAYDRNGSDVDTSITGRVTQLAYEDGTTAQQVLEDLMTLYPTHYWAVWGGDPVAQYGLPGYISTKGARFEWQPWPTAVSLDGLNTNLDDFADSGSSAELYNEVTVRWKDAVGRSFATLRTGSSPALTAAGLKRRAFIDLGSQMGNKAQAASIGDAFLLAHAYPSNGGTIKVRRPLRDMASGRLLRPRELRAGVLCRVANLSPQPDELNAAVTDGSTVFRVAAVNYSAKNDEATLTLDSYGRSVARQLAGLQRTVKRTRRL